MTLSHLQLGSLMTLTRLFAISKRQLACLAAITAQKQH